MIQIRKTSERGHFDFGWLDTYHTFSFGDYYDPENIHFRALRVINEDRVKPGEGFPTHGHRDMEIITCVLKGELEHKDSMGNGSVIRPGEIQRMSAGTGVTHSEYNHSKKEEVHLLQIWILPEKQNLSPEYEQKKYFKKRNELRLIASNHPNEGAVKIHQDALLSVGSLEKGKEIRYDLKNKRYVWIQMIEGSLDVNEIPLKTGDGAGISDETFLVLKANENSEFLLFDLA